MDGNGRWAARRGFPRRVGHMRGVSRVSEIVRACPELHIDTLTLYAFSTENWKRSAHEVEALMKIFRWYLQNKKAELHSNGVRVRFIGDPTPLADDIRQQMDALVKFTKDNTKLNLNVAINYGGRDELARACRKIAQKVQNGTMALDAINEDTVSDHLDTTGQLDPDLIIRTAGELRLSNFLVWQCAYSEFEFLELPWPEFTKSVLANTLETYRSRVRQFGALAGQAEEINVPESL